MVHYAMKQKLLIIPLIFLAVTAVISCTSPSYNSEKAAVLVSKIQNGEKLDNSDYIEMIEQAEAGLSKYSAALDTMNIASKGSLDSAMQVLAGNESFVKMINECLLMERVLRDAPLDKEARDSYSKFLKQQVEFKKKYHMQ